jgi:UDP-N-acetylglucosamine 2-epimerase (non-hydrolysing)
MIKVLTIVGTRPEIIKLSEVIKVLDKNTVHVLAHTGQNYDYELNEVFFKGLGVRIPDHFLEASKGSAAATIGDIIAKTDKLIADINPDAVLLYGDTNSCLSVISAKRRKVPIFHMEAGNRCFDARVPEEINRKIVDHTSDINMPLSEQARTYLIREGIPPDRIIKTGSPMKEVIHANMTKIMSSRILSDLQLHKDKYFLVSIHREENVDSPKNFKDLITSLEKIAEVYGYPIIVSTHPRTRKKMEELGYKDTNSLIKYLKPFGFHDYNKLQMNSFCTISDSGTIAEESSIFGRPAITIRQAHERPEGMDEGTLVMSGLNGNDIIDSINVVTKCKTPRVVGDYDVDNVSVKVLKIILSYYHFINRETWKKI